MESDKYYVFWWMKCDKVLISVQLDIITYDLDLITYLDDPKSLQCLDNIFAEESLEPQWQSFCYIILGQLENQ